MTDRCINPNNSRIVELAEELGKTKYEVAIDVKMWQDVNGNKIPTVDDLLGNPNVNNNLNFKLNNFLNQ